MEPTALIKSREAFRGELQDRIQKGEDILASFRNRTDYERVNTEYHAWHDYNLELLKASFNDPYNEYQGRYSGIGEWSGGIVFRRTPEEALQRFIDVFKQKIENLKMLRDKVDLLRTNVPSALVPQPPQGAPVLDTTQVFIVHGHDEAVKQEVARFVERLDLNPIILHEQASSGRTIIEKIEAYSNVGFAIVLYTPCDVGALKGEEDVLRDRARQNVVFEHGYLIGKIGRKNVCALVKGDVETPGDIDGVVYVSMHTDWKLKLAKELKSSGYDIDMNKAV